MKKRIIIADDDDGVRESMRRMLSPYYEIATARSGTEVLHLLKDGEYDGLLLDVRFENAGLGGMSGIDTADAVRRRGLKIKIVLFTAQTYSSQVRARIIDLGATFMEKPIELEAVRRVFDN